MDQIQKQIKEKVEGVICDLIVRNSFWGFLFSRVNKKYHFPGQICAVALENKEINLCVNSEYFSTMSKEDIEKVLVHEGYHLILKHLFRLRELKEIKKEKFNYEIFAIAVDMAANDVGDIKGGVTCMGKFFPVARPEMFNLPRNMAFEWYYHELEKKMKDESIPKEFKFDEHLIPKDIEKELRNLQNVMSKAADEWKRISNRGSDGGNLEELLNQFFNASLPYYELIRRFVKKSRRAIMQRRMILNKKKIYIVKEKMTRILPYPGYKRKRTFSIGVLIDTSGSMGLRDMAEGLSSIKNILEKDPDVSITVLENDTQVQKEYSVKKISDIQPKFHGRHGTTLQPGLARLKEINSDVNLVFTDGECDKHSRGDSHLPHSILWILNHRGSESQIEGTGPIIRLPEFFEE